MRKRFPDMLFKQYPMRLENVEKIRQILHTCGYPEVQEQRMLDMIVSLLQPVLEQGKT